MLSVITPTADRPIAFDLCERWMRRQGKAAGVKYAELFRKL